MKILLIFTLFFYLYSCKEININPIEENNKTNVEIFVSDRDQKFISDVKLIILQNSLFYGNYLTNSNGSTGLFQLSKGLYIIDKAIYNDVTYKIDLMINPFENNINYYYINLYSDTYEKIKLIFEKVSTKEILNRKVALLSRNFKISQSSFNEMLTKRIYETTVDSNNTLFLYNLSKLHFYNYSLLIYYDENDYFIRQFDYGKGNNTYIIVY